MSGRFRPLAPAQTRLLPGLFLDRFALNRRYVMSLDSGALLQNHMLEAGLWQARLGETKRNRNYDPGQLGREEALHWGWESPSCQLRGHFLGHWLSAAARPGRRRRRRGRRQGRRHRGRARPLPGGQRRRVGRLDPARLPRPDRAGPADLGAPLHDPQDPDGPVGHVRVRRQQAGARDPGPDLAAGSTGGRPPLPASRWTTSSTSRPAACSRSGRTSTASRATRSTRT